jgi:glutathione S-transferase
MTAPLTLVSHALCPYVQRAAIVLAEKGVAYRREVVDLSAKPAWFTALSPLGKTPLLLVGDAVIFESAVICEYLDDTLSPRLHPVDPLERARHRAWIEFGSALLSTIGGFYNAPDGTALAEKRDELAGRFARLEATLGEGPFFAGPAFTLVDAAYAPVFRYFDVFDALQDFGVFDLTPKVLAWRRALSQRPSVRRAVQPDYEGLLLGFLRRRRSALAQIASSDVALRRETGMQASVAA